MNEELNIIKELINDYKYKIENLTKEKRNKINEFMKKLIKIKTMKMKIIRKIYLIMKKKKKQN